MGSAMKLLSSSRLTSSSGLYDFPLLPRTGDSLPVSSGSPSPRTRSQATYPPFPFSLLANSFSPFSSNGYLLSSYSFVTNISRLSRLGQLLALAVQAKTGCQSARGRPIDAEHLDASQNGYGCPIVSPLQLATRLRVPRLSASTAVEYWLSLRPGSRASHQASTGPIFDPNRGKENELRTGDV